MQYHSIQTRLVISTKHFFSYPSVIKGSLQAYWWYIWAYPQWLRRGTLLCQNEIDAWRWKHFKSPPPSPPFRLCFNEFQSLASPLKLNMTWFFFGWTDSQSSIFLLWNGRFIIKVNWEGLQLSASLLKWKEWRGIKKILARQVVLIHFEPSQRMYPLQFTCIVYCLMNKIYFQ